MSNLKKKQYVRKRKTLPPVKSKILETLCDSEQLKLIRKLAAKGAVFIVLGSEHSPVHEFYKGIMQEMYAPTFNGGCVYDTYYKYRNAWERPYITVSLVDYGNATIVDSIKQLNSVRTKTLYSYNYGGDSNVQ